MNSSNRGYAEERRRSLLVLGADFVRAIRGMKGIERIALIGSLCTDKANPKDIDFLLSLQPGMDLKGLARPGRRLMGSAQCMASGADIFLVEGGRHIGRVCHYRECHPRVLCRALHCGLRPHLNDDLERLHLKDSVIAEPALVLWPEWKAKAEVPEDTLQILRLGLDGKIAGP